MKTANIWKKAITLATALLAAATLAIGTGTTALAAGSGTITVHKYARSTAGVPNPGNMYTGEAIADTSGLGKPLQGAGFSLYKLDTAALDTAIRNGNKFVSYSIANDNTVTFTLDGKGAPPVTAVTTAATIVGSEKKTDASGVAVFDTLEDAYYLLQETTTPVGYNACEKSVIRLPLTKANGTEHNRNIHVYPKNVSDAVPVTKTIDGDPKVLWEGDDILFTITADFRSANVSSVADLRKDGKYGEAYVIDKIQEYFKYVSVESVTLIGPAGNTVEPLAAGTDYTVDTSKLNGAGNGDLKVSLTEAGIDKAVAAGAASYAVKVKLQYLGAQGFIGNVAAELKNIAKSVVNKAGDPQVDPEDPNIPETEVYVPTTQIVLNKKDSKDNPFAGATFRLAKVANPTSDNDYVRDINGNVIELTTDANGLLSFNGVSYSELTGTTYYLKEIHTQPGYQLKVGTIAVTLEKKSDDSNKSQLDDKGDWISGAVVRASVTVVNYPNGEIDPEEPAFSLPLTGGAGTTILTIAGAATMLGAVAWFILRKKKGNA
ncbi:MAG: SpaH/EbpB family LPXTG-anchored major pilin [Oscillospiraceae bacterium]|nr:SpaH/EbpB family LPXTG-anchored major pilin [Oscillospiraceae bacterium]